MITIPHSQIPIPFLLRCSLNAHVISLSAANGHFSTPVTSHYCCPSIAGLPSLHRAPQSRSGLPRLLLARIRSHWAVGALFDWGRGSVRQALWWLGIFCWGYSLTLTPIAPFCGVLLLFSGRHFASGKMSRFARLLLGVKGEERGRVRVFGRSSFWLVCWVFFVGIPAIIKV